MEKKNNNIPAIDIRGLTRHFGHVKAVNDINLVVEKQGVYGILGPNGAGKTTLIRMLATLLHPTSGTAKIFGNDIVSQKDAVRYLVSLTGQFASVDDDLTGYENLVLLSKLHGYSSRQSRDRAKDLLEGFGLADAARRQVKTYSGGMRKRLDIAASIVVRPSLLFLDEPTTGLDPRSRNQVWDIIRELVSGGTTVLLTTQYLEEADRLAGRIAVIDHGKLIAEGTPGELKASVGSNVLKFDLMNGEDREKANRIIADISGYVPREEAEKMSISVQLNDPSFACQIISGLYREGIAVSGFSLSRPSLDEVFLALTGKAAEEEMPES